MVCAFVEVTAISKIVGYLAKPLNLGLKIETQTIRGRLVILF